MMELNEHWEAIEEITEAERAKLLIMTEQGHFTTITVLLDEHDKAWLEGINGPVRISLQDGIVL